MSNVRPRPFLINQLITATETHYMLPKGCIRSSQRAARVKIARHMACLIAWKELGLSYPQIGKGLNMHHTSVMYGARKAAKLLQEAAYAADYQAILARVERIAQQEMVSLPPPPPKPTPVLVKRPEPTPKPKAEKRADSNRRTSSKSSAAWDDCYPPRKWWNENNDRFCEAMRKIHPEREVRPEAQNV